MNETTRDVQIKDAVRQSYGRIARRFTEKPERGMDPERATGKAARAGCCGPRQAVTIRQSARCCEPGQATGARQSAGCCGPSRATAAQTTAADRFYSSAELAGLPDSVTEASLGCGNPIAIAALRPGEDRVAGSTAFWRPSKLAPKGR
jgi:hypothetical protein